MGSHCAHDNLAEAGADGASDSLLDIESGANQWGVSNSPVHFERQPACGAASRHAPLRVKHEHRYRIVVLDVSFRLVLIRRFPFLDFQPLSFIKRSWLLQQHPLCFSEVLCSLADKECVRRLIHDPSR